MDKIFLNKTEESQQLNRGFQTQQGNHNKTSNHLTSKGSGSVLDLNE
jgi:hypothetical protein